MLKKIILFGGMFDPIHNGHLYIAKIASLKLNADVYFILTKKQKIKIANTNINNRYNMLKISLNNTKHFFLCDYEIKSKKKINYTIDTINYFVKKFKKYKLYLLIGADQVEKFHLWKDAQKIASIVKIICVNRNNIDLKKNNNFKKFNMILLRCKKKIISSEMIRNLKKLDISKKIIDYIANHKIYYIRKINKYYTYKRFKHVISVANLAYKIARKNKLKITICNKCYIAGLLHDIAKKMNLELQKKIINEKFINKINLHPNLYHQFVGAYIVQNELKINDKEIINAINCHTTGKKNMNEIDKILYCADKLDPLRKIKNSYKAINLCFKNYNVGFKNVFKNYHLNKNKIIN